MRDLEDDILRETTALLKDRSFDLAHAGLTYQGPEIEVWRSAAESYESEIRVTILRGGNIEHVLETHIYRDGSALVTPNEALEWFDRHLREIIGRYRDADLGT